MKLLITAPDNETYARFFPAALIERLQGFGEVERNPFSRSFTAEELRQRITDADILITHWGTPKIDAAMLEHAPQLRLVAHAAGSVANIASEALYERNIPVISANPIMARYVAESVLGYMIAGTHRFLQTDSILRAGGWDPLTDAQGSLFHAKIGLIGLGTVGRILLDLLAPCQCEVSVYAPWEFVRLCDFETAMRNQIVSIHASKTPETYHLINKEALALLPAGAVLINSARGSIIDTEALISALKEKRLYAVLDVYEKEGAGNISEELLSLTTDTLLQPHAAAVNAGPKMTEAIADDIERFIQGEPLQLRVSRSQFLLMTQE